MKDLTVTVTLEDKDVKKMTKFMRTAKYCIFMDEDGLTKTFIFENGCLEIKNEDYEEDIEEEMDLILDNPELAPDLTFSEYID